MAKTLVAQSGSGSKFVPLTHHDLVCILVSLLKLGKLRGSARCPRAPLSIHMPRRKDGRRLDFEKRVVVVSIADTRMC